MRIPKPSEIRAMRTKLGLTQSQLAKLAGVTQAYIAKIEAGDADPKVSTLEKILTALERTVPERPATADVIMTTPVLSVSPTDRIGRAVRLMESKGISQLPVLDGQVQVGSISEATLMHRIAAGDDMAKLIERAVGEIMEESFPTVAKHVDVDTVYSLLEDNPAVIVVDRGRAVGIVTKADVLKLMRGK